MIEFVKYYDSITDGISVHERYKDFAALTQQEAIHYIDNYYKK